MLSEERIDAIFKEMVTYILELNKDPGSLGPNYFQDVIATCRNYLNRVSLVISEVSQEKLAVSSELRKLEAAYSLEYDDLIANSDRVRSLSSVEDRKATAGFMLRNQREAINDLKDQMHELESVYKVVNHRNRELHATMAAIKDQRRLVKIEIESGSFYGDERTTKGEAVGGMAVDEGLNEQELADMLADESESPEDPESEEIPEDPESEEEASPEEEAVVQFLESPEEPMPEKSDKPAEPQPVVEPDPISDEMRDIVSILEEL